METIHPKLNESISHPGKNWNEAVEEKEAEIDLERERERETEDRK